MKTIFLTLFFFTLFINKNLNAYISPFSKAGSIISQIMNDFKNGYYSSEIDKKKSEIEMRLKMINNIFKELINEIELTIILDHYYKYIKNDSYNNDLLDDIFFNKIIEKLDSIIASKKFELFFQK